jgi:mono/diheme cytochrome c family protein
MDKKMRLATALALVAATAACSHASQSSTTSTSTTSATTAPMAAAASPSAAATTVAAMPSNGASVYATNCSSCHQASGQGVPGTFPPLAGNPVVTGPAAAVIHIVKAGLSGAITVKGTTYSGQMPAWQSTLSNNDIAAVVSYVRNSWGNHASSVTSAQVAATK